jgi:hypothetical protein
MSIWSIPKPEPSSAGSSPLDKNKNAQGGRVAKGSPMDKPAATASPAPSDVVVGVLSRPQASLADFYRELGHSVACE